VFVITRNALVSSYGPPQSVATVSFFSNTSLLSPNPRQFFNSIQAIASLLFHVSSTPEYQLRVI